MDLAVQEQQWIPWLPGLDVPVIPGLPQTRTEAHQYYLSVLADTPEEEMAATYYELGKKDFWFFLTYILESADYTYLDNDWVFRQTRVFQLFPWGHLDLWFRGGFKTTICTVGYSLWRCLYEPECTIGIFSITKVLAKKIGKQMERYLKQEFMHWVFECIPADDKLGNTDDGYTLIRNANPRESTFEFHGLETLPTGRHFWYIRIDDAVDATYITNVEMIDKAVSNLRLMRPLMRPQGEWGAVGTRYGNNDPYYHMLEGQVFQPRIHTPTHNGMPPAAGGILVFWSLEIYRKWVFDLGPYHASCQLWQRPEQTALGSLRLEWLTNHFWDPTGPFDKLNIYIIVDMADSQVAGRDYTAMWVIGLSEDQNMYAINFFRDRLDIGGRIRMLMALHRTYRPKMVFYEKVGAQADLGAIRMAQAQNAYRFEIHPVNPAMAKGSSNKILRLNTLQPWFEAGRIWLPRWLGYKMYDGREVDMVQVFIHEEYLQSPYPSHDDLLDALAYFTDGSLEGKISFPKSVLELDIPTREIDPFNYF